MSKELEGYRKLYPSYRASFPANVGGIFLAGQVVRLNVCLPRHSFSDGWCGSTDPEPVEGSRDPACPAIALATAEENLMGNGWLNKKTSSFDILSEAQALRAGGLVRNSIFVFNFLEFLDPLLQLHWRRSLLIKDEFFNGGKSNGYIL
jgi:hypothetical protein